MFLTLQDKQKKKKNLGFGSQAVVGKMIKCTRLSSDFKGEGRLS